MKAPFGIEPVVWLLSALLVFFTASLFCAEWWFKSDAQFFQVIAAAFGGMSGALLTKIKVDSPPTPPQAPQVPHLPQLPQVPQVTELVKNGQEEKP